MTEVKGNCPMGCGETLFLADEGHVTCSFIDCPRPTAANELLHLSSDHHVTFDKTGFTVEHPPRERIEGTMHLCDLHAYLRELDEAPVAPGRYRATFNPPHGGWLFEEVGS